MCPVRSWPRSETPSVKRSSRRRLRTALLRLNEWITEEQVDRVIFNMEHVDATGMARNRDRPRVSDLRHAHGCRWTEWATDSQRPIL